MNPNERDFLKAIEARNALISANNKLALKTLIFSMIGLILALLLLIFIWVSDRQPVYFAGTPSGEFKRLVPLNNPLYTDAVVQDWSNKCLVDTLSFNFTNFKPHLSKQMALCFTDAGGEALERELSNAGVLRAIEDKQIFMSLVLDHTPIISQKARGRLYAWRLQARAKLTYRTMAKEISQNIIISIEVQRESLIAKRIGLGIHKIAFEKVK